MCIVGLCCTLCTQILDVNDTGFTIEVSLTSPGFVYYAVLRQGETPSTAFKLKVVAREEEHLRSPAYIACGCLACVVNEEGMAAELIQSERVGGLNERTTYEVYAITNNPEDNRCSRLTHVQTVLTGKEPLPPISKKRYEPWLALALKAMAFNAVEELSLVFKGVDDDQASAVAAYLKDNESIKVLSLHRNEIGDAGAMAIADALQYNTHLEQLFLNYNSIGTRGLQALCDVLENNISLKLVCLTHNREFSHDLRGAFQKATRNKDPQLFQVLL